MKTLRTFVLFYIYVRLALRRAIKRNQSRILTTDGGLPDRVCLAAD